VERSPSTINTIDSLRRRLPSIVDTVNADPELALRAAANPLLALAELGYVLSPELRQQAEDRVRFTVAEAAELTSLRSEIAHQLPGKLDLGSLRSLTRALGAVGVHLSSSEVAAGPAAPMAQGRARSMRKKSERRPPVIEVPPVELARDDSRRLIEALRARIGDHPVVKPLVRYLELEASRPRLADQATYERLRSTTPQADASTVTIRFGLASERDAG
jgi:hypothetical protein